MTTKSKELDKLIDNISQTRAGSRTERCHGIPHHGSYSNARHQWGVAALLWALFPNDFHRLVSYALFHDEAEFIVGDIPAPTMRYTPGLRETIGKLEGNICEEMGLPREDRLRKEDHAILKACDRLDFYLWSLEEVLMGNHMVDEGIVEVERVLGTELKMPEPANSFFLRVKQLGTSAIRPRQAGVMKAAAAKLVA